MEKDLGKIKKNDQTDIIVRLDDFGGKVGLTIREFTTSERYTGFTKSGTRIPLESLEEFKQMINSLDENEAKSMQENVQTNETENSEKNQNTEKTPETNTDESESKIEEEVF
jgi:hypothetical protein